MHRYRTHTCNDLRTTHIGQRARLSGWLHNRRDLGGVEFIELRDHYGLTQLVIRPGSAAQETVSKAPKETTICVEGVVVNRGADNVNSELATGDVELEVESVEILGECDPLPFSVFPEREVGEDTRLRYRYLDLRRSKLHQNIILRSKVISSIRRRMIGEGFNEFQTPILTASSPEGARDYLVPSRVHPGKFYALPQAPQMFKQLLMMSGFDRYFQIAPCFRDEDGRADRSPGEFYQLDLEMSFVTQEDVFTVVERVLHGIFEEFSDGRKVTPLPFPRIPFDESMVTYGSDKPDLRNPLKIKDLTELFRESEFRAFAGKFVRVLPVPGLAAKPRAFFDKLEERAKADGAPGLAWLAVQDDLTFKGPIAKFLSAEIAKELIALTDVKAGDALLFSAGETSHGSSKILGSLRNFLGAELKLLDESRFDLCWIVDFPMYERDSQTGKIDFSHNPFSMPQGELEALNTMDPLDIKAFQYDIVCNGIELSSGAIRNHKPEIMYRAFEIAGYTREQVDSRFSGMINALKFGAPPHGGTAPGIDRIVMLLANEPNIREVVAFPMNQKAQDLLMNAPAEVRPEQLQELHIRLEMPKV